MHDSPEAKSKSEELEDEPSANIAFVPLAMPSTAGPGTIAMIISSASTVRRVHLRTGLLWLCCRHFCLWCYCLGCLRSSGAIMGGGQGWHRSDLPSMGILLVCMGVQFIINGVLNC
ncbi:MarC family protein [Shigella flexneri]